MNAVNVYPPYLLEDLQKSGLSPADVKAKPLTAGEKTATNTPQGIEGYVLPYFNMYSHPIPFYRVRLFGIEPKYRQVINSTNHIYFPPHLGPLLPNAQFLLWCEGEKKAAACVKAGFPAVSVGGIENWRNRTLLLPKDMKLSQTKSGAIAARLPSGALPGEQIDTVATGYDDVLQFIIRRKIPLIICYDWDPKPDTQFNVQRAAATLGFDLRFKGVPSQHIRQMFLPNNGVHKVAVDDILQMEDGNRILGRLIQDNLKKRSAFPRHPNPREYVNKKLQRTNLPRQEQQALAFAILTDLDAKGSRLKNMHDGSSFYFDYDDRKLTRVNFETHLAFHSTPFGIKLYRDYNLSAADARVIGWLGAQFSGEEPISNVSPERVLAVRGDTLYYQLNDGQMVKVEAAYNPGEGIKVVDNGSDNVLFEAGMVEEASEARFKKALETHAKQPLQNQWYEVLKSARLGNTPNDNNRRLLSLLYYLSPWFYKWRGTQLPVEITCGEPGSGKSTLYQLRLDILTGIPKLRNAPADMRDWAASLANSGGLHVTDNVQLMDQNLRQKLSDELCRLVTEPSPSIEQRKLYSNQELVQIPVKCVFAITAVKQPFTNVDIIQRSIITELDKGTDADLKYDSNWEEQQLYKFGGREAWLAHHMLFIEAFMQLASQKWDPKYRAKYRLINVEQMLMLAAQVFGWDYEWIPDFLEGQRDRRMSESDWALEGLAEWIEAMKLAHKENVHNVRFFAGDVVSWAEDEEDFKACNILQNTRSLGRYLASHKHVVASTIGLVPSGLYGNKQAYYIKKMQNKHAEA